MCKTFVYACEPGAEFFLAIYRAWLIQPYSSRHRSPLDSKDFIERVESVSLSKHLVA